MVRSSRSRSSCSLPRRCCWSRSSACLVRLRVRVRVRVGVRVGLGVGVGVRVRVRAEVRVRLRFRVRVRVRVRVRLGSGCAFVARQGGGGALGAVVARLAQVAPKGSG